MNLSAVDDFSWLEESEHGKSDMMKDEWYILLTWKVDFPRRLIVLN